MHHWLFLVALTALYVAYVYMSADQFDPDSIHNKRVLVTGASTGIGEELAYTYARLGARLVITARRESLLHNVTARCRQLGSEDGAYHFIAADVSDMSQTKRVMNAVVEKLGGLDILVLNHKTVTPLSPYLGTANNLTLFDRALDVNTRAYVHLASHALPLLQQSSGSIIVVSSFGGKVPSPMNFVYGATKFALDGFFHGLRQELALRGVPISVTVCILGYVATENAMEKFKDADALKPADVGDTALAIIKGGASRLKEVYHPYWTVKTIVMLRDWVPVLHERMFAKMMAPLLKQKDSQTY